jgi:hypothetical protein
MTNKTQRTLQLVFHVVLIIGSAVLAGSVWFIGTIDWFFTPIMSIMILLVCGGLSAAEIMTRNW